MRRVHGLEAERRRCVSHERHLIAEFSATASSRLNAGVRHHSCHDNFNAELLELEVEVRCWRAGDDLFFASIGHFGEGLKAALAANRPPERHVLLDADSVNFRRQRLRRADECNQGVAKTKASPSPSPVCVTR